MDGGTVETAAALAERLAPGEAVAVAIRASRVGEVVPPDRLALPPTSAPASPATGSRRTGSSARRPTGSCAISRRRCSDARRPASSWPATGAAGPSRRRRPASTSISATAAAGSRSRWPAAAADRRRRRGRDAAGRLGRPRPAFPASGRTRRVPCPAGGAAAGSRPRPVDAQGGLPQGERRGADGPPAHGPADARRRRMAPRPAGAGAARDGADPAGRRTARPGRTAGPAPAVVVAA